MSENMQNRIREITEEVESYQQAIRDAQGALEAAERELDEALSAAINGETVSGIPE